MAELLKEQGIEVAISSFNNAVGPEGVVYIVQGTLERGFEYPTIKTVVISDGETSDRQKRSPRLKGKSGKDVIKSFITLKGSSILEISINKNTGNRDLIFFSGEGLWFIFLDYDLFF